MTKEEKRTFLDECEEHVFFCRNMNDHAWTNILIKKLMDIILEQDPELQKKEAS